MKLLLVLLAYFAVLGAGVVHAEANSSEIEISTAQLWLGVRPNPDADPSGPESLTVTLPDLWTIKRRHLASSGWYVASVQIGSIIAENAKSQPMALLISNHSGQLQVYWDGQFLEQSMPLTGVGLPYASGPLLIPIAENLLHPGTHRLELSLTGKPSRPDYVGLPILGPLEDLKGRFVVKRFVLMYAPISLGVFSIFAALVFFLTFRTDPSAKGTRWLTAGLLCAATSVLGFYFSVPVEWTGLFDRIRPMTFHLSYLFFLFALNQLRPNYNRFVQGFFGLVCVGFSIATLSVDELYVYAVLVYWMPFTYALALILMIQAAKLILRAWDRWFPLIPLIAVVVITVHDAHGLMSGANFLVGQALSVYNPSLFAFTLMFLLVGRAQHAVAEMRSLNRNLESRIADKHRELQANYDLLSTVEKKAAIKDERARMVREMHDGLGGQLVSTLAMVESGKFSSVEVEEALRDSLDDLRMMVNSQDHEEATLVELLAMLRQQIEPRLTRQGMQFNWRIQPLPRTSALAPEQATHVLRILQEAFTNILKHSHASVVTLTTGIENGEAYLCIEDNGQGLLNANNPSTGGNSGRGIGNMRHRVQQLGGTLAVASGQQGLGTRITLRLPA